MAGRFGEYRTDMKALCGLCLLLAPLCGVADEGLEERIFETERHRFRIVHLARNLNYPWALAFLPDGRILVTELPGSLRVVRAGGGLEEEPIAGLPEIVQTGQGGLLDVALHPKFEDNSWVYLAYAARGRDGVGTEVARGRLRRSRLEDVEVLFRAAPKFRGGRHFGSRLLFSADGHLLITLGDRGQREQAQDLASHPGSVIRLRDDGSVPVDNPFQGQAGARPEILTYGNRNVQGIVRDPQRGIVWMHEHGPQGGDELNRLIYGANYGWPVVTYGRNYVTGTAIGEGTTKQGVTPPVHYWVPSIAPSGLAYLSGDAFPGWQGNLFVGSLKFKLLVRLELDAARVTREERMLQGVLGRIRDVRAGDDGRLYLLTDSPRGVLVRLDPVAQ